MAAGVPHLDPDPVERVGIDGPPLGACQSEVEENRRWRIVYPARVEVPLVASVRRLSHATTGSPAEGITDPGATWRSVKPCSRRRWSATSSCWYTRDEVDFFLGYVVETDSVYVFPFEATERFRSTLNLWILRQPTNHNGSPAFDPAPFRNAFDLMSS